MSAKYTTVMLPDGTILFKSFGWTRLDDSSSVDWCAMNDWHTELVKEVGIDPETGRKTVFTYKPTNERYIDPETGESTGKVTCTIGKYDFARAAEYHSLAPGDMVVVEHDDKIWRCSSDHCGSPRRGVRCSGRGNLTGFVR